ncbi:MAG: DUF58 domain-containing protein [Dehalococcoidia bacterium]|nr:MAG: DUF58 domain-containing protein [Dehalococcoidia bacterium]
MKREDVLLLLVILLFVQGYLFNSAFPAILAAAILFYLVHLRVEFVPRIEFNREINPTLKDGKRAKAKLKVRNQGHKEFKIHIFENLPKGFETDAPLLFLNAAEERDVEYSIKPVRGFFRIKDPMVRVVDLQDLYYNDFMPELGSEKEIEVYPNLDKIREESEIGEALNFKEAYRTLFGLQTPELDSLREFQSGDEMRHIDWKATMRLRKRIVKDFIKENEGGVYIILDAGKEMRKGIKRSKIDFATTLALQLAYALRKYPLGMIVYDDFEVKRTEAAKGKGVEQVERIAALLNIGTTYSSLLGIKLPMSDTGFKLKEESRSFISKILPAIKGKRSSATGLVEAVSILPSTDFLIFISDITSNTGELIKILLELRGRYRILLLAPNPILFYDEESLDRETLIWLYRRYKERANVIRKLNGIVPTYDLGPSDLLETIRRRGALE